MASGNETSRAGLLHRSRPPITLAVLLGLALGAAPGLALAKRSHVHPTHAAPRQKKVPNMPAGWTWPPSPEMREAGERCLERLKGAGVQFEPGPEKARIVTPVVVPSWTFGGVKLVPLTRRRPLVVDCHLAEALAVAGGPDLKAIGVAELRFTSLYEYRNVKRRRVLSRHAVGLAIDIYEVVGTDGVVRRVPRDYRKADGFLKLVERTLKKSGLFRTPLTPSTEPRGHSDHFHLEARTSAERAEVPNT
jgi:hypothetical protein